MKKDKFTVNILYTAILAACLFNWSLVDTFVPDFVLASPGPMVVIASAISAITLATLICREQKLFCAECLIFGVLTSLLLPLAAGFLGRDYFFLAGAGLIAFTVFSLLFDGMKRRLDGPVAIVVAGIICYFACQCCKGLI